MQKCPRRYQRPKHSLHGKLLNHIENKAILMQMQRKLESDAASCGRFFGEDHR